MKWQYFNSSLLFYGISILFLPILFVEKGYGQQILTREIPFFPTREDSLAEILEDSLKHSNPSIVLEKFLTNETGSVDHVTRGEYLTYSDSAWAKEEALNPDSPGNICDLNIGKYYIVRDFHTMPLVKINDSTAVGDVFYDQIAMHFDDTVRIAQKANDTVTYRLVKKDGRWKVKDPPMQRVILEVIRNWFNIETHPRFRGGLLVGRVPNNMTFEQLESLWSYNLLVLDSIR
jgi:hypothetical protein